MKNSEVIIFADDVKLLKMITNEIDSVRLQQDVDQLQAYCVENGLILNEQKCTIMTIHRKRNPLNINYSINDTRLERVERQKDLGIWFDSGLHFNIHFEQMETRCYAIMGLIKKNDNNRMKPETIILLYNALVRSIIEYGRIIWDRHAITLTKRTESIQKQIVIYALRKTEKRDSNFKLLPYVQRCAKLNLQTLERRRSNYEIYFIYDLIIERTNAPCLQNKMKHSTDKYELRNNRPLIIEGRIVNNIQYLDPLRIAAKAFNNIFKFINAKIMKDRKRFRNLIVMLSDEQILNQN